MALKFVYFLLAWNIAAISTAESLKLAEILLPSSLKNTIYLINLDPGYLNLSQSDVPIILDDISDHKFTRDQPNFKINSTHHGPQDLIGIASIGSKSIQHLKSTIKSICFLSHVGPDYASLLKCPATVAHTFIIVVEGKDHGLQSSLLSRIANLDRLSSSILTLWHSNNELEHAVVLCMHCTNKSLSIQNVHAPRLQDAHKTYELVRNSRGSCQVWGSSRSREIHSPFHNSSNAAVDQLECSSKFGRIYTFVTPSLISHVGNYPESADFILGTRSRPVYIITQQQQGSRGSNEIMGGNIYFSPFKILVWTFLFCTLVAYSVVIVCFIPKRFRLVKARAMALSLIWSTGVLLDQINDLYRTTNRILILSLAIPAVCITNLYRGALHTEFAISDDHNKLDIDRIEDLWDNRFWILLRGEACHTLVAKNRSDVITSAIICDKKPMSDECIFYEQAQWARLWEYTDKKGSGTQDVRLKQLDAIRANMSFACVKDIPDIVRKREKYVLIISERNLKHAWTYVEGVMKLNRSIRLAYMQDSDTSYFVSINGVQLPMRLGPHQYYVRTILNSLVHSGINQLWKKWEHLRASERNEKLNEFEDDAQGPSAISMDNSWLSQVFKFCFVCCGVCFCVFAVEIAFKYL